MGLGIDVLVSMGRFPSSEEACMKVMLIDHEKALREAHRAMLIKLGYEDVVEATDGQDALSKVFVSNPDLIVIEHTMPGMNGIVFVQTYHARGGAAPVLMLDEKADRKKVVEALKAGVVSFLLRPVEPDVFAQHILRCLMKRKSA
jgi:two-component system chemotaxis response regulator CheY